MRAESYELYSSFPAYANLMTEQQRRIIVLYAPYAFACIQVSSEIMENVEFFSHLICHILSIQIVTTESLF